MNRQLSRAFIAPVVEHWAGELGKKLALVSTGTRPAVFRATDVVVTGLVSGRHRGRVCLVLDESTAKVVYSALRGRWSDTLSDGALDTIAAVARDLFKKASDALSSDGFSSQVRFQGVSVSTGEPLGAPGDSGDLVHLQAVRPGSGEKDEVRVWIGVPDPEPSENGARPAATSRNGKDSGDLATTVQPAGAKPPGTTLSQTPVQPDARATQPGRPEAAPASAAAAPSKALAAPTPAKDAVADLVRAKRFELVDGNGKTRATMAAMADGSPHIVLADADGRIRIAIALARSGAPRVMLLDELGERIWEKP